MALVAARILEGVDDVRISKVAVAHPPHRVTQDEAARRIGVYAGDSRRVAAIARGTRIAQRAVAVPPEELICLGSIGSRNDLYQSIAPGLAVEASRGVLGEGGGTSVGCVVTTSCTGYSVPSWGVGLVEVCALPRSAMRLPITEAGCAGGVVALARAVDHLRAHPDERCADGGGSALVASVELCSLAFHAGGDDGNLTSTLIFGDGAGAALLERGAGPGLGVVDSMSVLVPGSQHALGFDLTDRGFYPILGRELATLLPGPTGVAVAELLTRNNLACEDIDAWLLHPGGARILAALEQELGIERERARWSWDSMREFGNTSSAAIFDVMRRYFEERTPGEYVIAAAFGPGVSIELLLLRAA